MAASEPVTVRSPHDFLVRSDSGDAYVTCGSTQPLVADEIAISFFEDGVPDFAEAELERLYRSIYSSLARLRIYAQDRHLRTYIARKGTEVVALFLFRLDGRQITVLNQQTSIDAAEIARFAGAAFFRFSRVTAISFWGMTPPQGALPLLSQRNYCLSDVVVALPASAEAYLSSLGKSTRRHVRGNLKKLTQSFPSFRAKTFVRGDINAQHVYDIIRLSNARMSIKDNVSYNSDEETQRLIRLANVYGMVLTLSIGDRVCAGSVCYRVGSTYFAQVLAHDPIYDEYKLGLVCCYLMMCECIARGGSEVRLGGSTHRYKFDFRGELARLDYVVVYRSIVQALVHSPSAIRMSIDAYRSRLKLWLLLADRRDDRISRIASHMVDWVRRLKRSPRAL
jgi:hypothetical protein